MLIRAETCPVCQRQIRAEDLQCPTCGCVVQFTPEPPVFSRRDVVEALVLPTIQLTRERINRNPDQGLAHYLLGLCYLNLNFFDRGTAEWQAALLLLPDQDLIRFELAMVQLEQGKHASALDQVRQALNVAPNDPEYRYIERYLSGRGAWGRGDSEGAIRAWIAAYEIGPHWSLAADELRQFVLLHEGILTSPDVLRLRLKDPRDAERLRVLNTDPRGLEMVLPTPPEPPAEPGQLSMNMLYSLTPGLAARVEAIHRQRMAAYEAAAQDREQKRRQQIDLLKSEMARWREQVRAIRSDLGAMARLCLAVIEADRRTPRSSSRRYGAARGTKLV